MKNLVGKHKYLLVIVFIIVVTIIITKNQDKLHNYSQYGYLGIFVACFAANSTVFLPAPSSTIVFTFSAVYTPFWVAVFGALGATLGEATGYIAGFSGRRLVISSEKGQQVKSYLEKYKLLAVLIFAFIPLPLFDLVGVAAGVSKINFISFLLACALGKTFKMMIYAFSGAGLLPLLQPLINGIGQ